MCLQNCPLSQLEKSHGMGYVSAKPWAAKCWVSNCYHGSIVHVYNYVYIIIILRLLGIQQEQEVAKCNTLSELRNIATKNSGFISAVQDSLSPVKVLPSNIFSRLCLHDRVIKMFTNGTTTEISDFWSTLLITDSSLRESV